MSTTSTTTPRLWHLLGVLAWIVAGGLAVGAAVVWSGVFNSEEGGQYQPVFADTVEEADLIYIFGVHPLHNPQRLHEVYQPVIDLINNEVRGVKLVLEASRDYATFDRKLLVERKFHFALPNPLQMVLSTSAGYRIFGRMSEDFHGVILVRADSPIQQVIDLRGKTVAYPARTALGATMMPQYYLHTHGLDVRTDIKNLYVGSQESSIMSVYLGTAAAAATWQGPWAVFNQTQPDIARQIKVMWVTEDMPNNGLVVREDIPAHLLSQVAKVLFSMPESPQGREIMALVGVTRFEPADNKTYQPVHDFVDRYKKAIGEVPQ